MAPGAKGVPPARGACGRVGQGQVDPGVRCLPDRVEKGVEKQKPVRFFVARNPAQPEPPARCPPPPKGQCLPNTFRLWGWGADPGARRPTVRRRPLARLALLAAGSLGAEFQPWLQWTIFDALLALLARWAAKRFPQLEGAMDLVGWL